MAKVFRIRGKYLNENCYVRLGRYGNGEPAIELMSVCGEPMSVPTVNLEAYDEHPQPGNVFVKDYEETAGIYDSLAGNGIVGPILRIVEFGFNNLCQAYECELLIKEPDAMLR